ncbi:MAG: hypothetical protein AAGM67_02190, partial [Bacteroidota bacterium]
KAKPPYNPTSSKAPPIGVFAYTSLMDRHPVGVLAEGCRLLLGAGIILQTGSWFGLETVIGGALLLVGLYGGLAFGLTLYFTYFEKGVETKGATIE